MNNAPKLAWQIWNNKPDKAFVWKISRNAVFPPGRQVISCEAK